MIALSIIAVVLSVVAVVASIVAAVAFHRASSAWRDYQRQTERDLRCIQHDNERMSRRIVDHEQRLDRAEEGLDRHDESIGPSWVTGIGRMIRMADMTDCHLRNAIAWCEENHKDASDLRDELKQRRYNKRMEAKQ